MQHPEIDRLQADPQYSSDPAYKVEVDVLRRMIVSFEAALDAEGIEGAWRDRIVNRLLYGQPNGARAREGM